MITDCVVMLHRAYRAGKHYDIRFRLGRNCWFSCRVLGVTGELTGVGKRLQCIRVKDHSDAEALFTGEIPRGEYGGGVIEEYVRGRVDLDEADRGYRMTWLTGAYRGNVWRFVHIGGKVWYLFRTSKSASKSD